MKLWHWSNDFAGRHTDLAAFLIVLAGLLYRFRVAAESFLNPDEAFHSMLAAGAGLDFLSDLPIAASHPPLLMMILRVTQQFGYSEVVMRTPIVLASGLFPWFIYLWLCRIRRNTSGLIALAILVISPTMFDLGIQLRGYMPMIFFLSVSLYLLQRALDEDSVIWMGLFPIPLGLAACTEYAAVFPTAAMGIYFLAATRSYAVSKKVNLVWLAGQIGLALLYAGLQSIRAPHLTGGGVTISPLNHLASQYWVGDGNPLSFFLGQTFLIFRHVFASPYLGAIGLLAFLFGLWFLWSGRRLELAPRRPSGRELNDGRWRHRGVALLLIAPFCLGWLAGILDVYPYGPSRHSMYLAPFVAAGAAIGLEALVRRRVALVLLAVAALGPIWFLRGDRDSVVMPRLRRLRPPLMEAVAYFESNVPHGSVVLSDRETALIFSHYVAPELPWPRGISTTIVPVQGYTFFSPSPTFSGFAAVCQDLPKWREYTGAAPDSPVWVVDTGFHTATRHEWLRNPELQELVPLAWQFGRGVFIFRIPANIPCEAFPEPDDNLR